jgi:hypothetical protein
VTEGERPDPQGGWMPPAAPGPPPGYAGPPPHADPGNGAAVWGFGLGTTGLVLMFAVSPLLFIPALPFAIAGWVVSKQARDKIRNGETNQGRAWADAGYAVGIGTTVICAIAINIAILIVVLD